jgi:hypothetical protein
MDPDPQTLDTSLQPMAAQWYVLYEANASPDAPFETTQSASPNCSPNPLLSDLSHPKILHFDVAASTSILART